jgi:phage shock protein C
MNANLQRSSTDKIVAGVCGGLGRHFGADTVIVRLVFLAWIFFFGASLIVFAGGDHQIALRLILFSALSFCLSPIVYLALWVVMPKQQEQPAQARLLQQVSPAGSHNPTGEWQFDPYTGRAIRQERSSEH